MSSQHSMSFQILFDHTICQMLLIYAHHVCAYKYNLNSYQNPMCLHISMPATLSYLHTWIKKQCGIMEQ